MQQPPCDRPPFRHSALIHWRICCRRGWLYSPGLAKNVTVDKCSSRDKSRTHQARQDWQRRSGGTLSRRALGARGLCRARRANGTSLPSSSDSVKELPAGIERADRARPGGIELADRATRGELQVPVDQQQARAKAPQARDRRSRQCCDRGARQELARYSRANGWGALDNTARVAKLREHGGWPQLTRPKEGPIWPWMAIPPLGGARALLARAATRGLEGWRGTCSSDELAPTGHARGDQNLRCKRRAEAREGFQVERRRSRHGGTRAACHNAEGLAGSSEPQASESMGSADDD